MLKIIAKTVFVLILVIGFLFWILAKPKPKYGSTQIRNEVYYTKALANKYKWRSSVKTPVGTYCDLVTPTMAVEVEWTTKPYEAVGQCLHYSQELKLKPAILFLESSENPPRSHVLDRVGKVASKYGIEIWWVNVDSELMTLEKGINK